MSTTAWPTSVPFKRLTPAPGKPTPHPEQKGLKDNQSAAIPTGADHRSEYCRARCDPCWGRLTELGQAEKAEGRRGRCEKAFLLPSNTYRHRGGYPGRRLRLAQSRSLLASPCRRPFWHPSGYRRWGQGRAGQGSVSDPLGCGLSRVAWAPTHPASRLC